MTVGMLAELNGVDEKTYERINDALNLYNDAPKGLLLHSAGPIPGGFKVFDIWESKELFEQFLTTRLEKAFKQAGVTGSSVQPEFFPIYNTYAPQPNRIARLTAVVGSR